MCKHSLFINKLCDQVCCKSSTSRTLAQFSDSLCFCSQGFVAYDPQERVSKLLPIDHWRYSLVAIDTYSQVLALAGVIICIVPLRQDDLWNASPD